METYFVGWIIFFVFICLVEVMTQQLVAIWFAAGGLVCVFASYFDVAFYMQLIIFIVVSSGTLLLLRPYAMKYAKKSIIQTNVQDVVGKTAIVMEDFDSATYEGRVKLEGLDWAAKAENNAVLSKGQKVEIQAVEGVKLIVCKKEEE